MTSNKSTIALELDTDTYFIYFITDIELMPISFGMIIRVVIFIIIQIIYTQIHIFNHSLILTIKCINRHSCDRNVKINDDCNYEKGGEKIDLEEDKKYKKKIWYTSSSSPTPG